MALSARLKAAGKFALKHLAVSVLVAAVCAALVFAVWYPYPYSELASGRELFALVVSVDVVVGPLLSFLVYSPAKRRSELWRDLGVIFLLQAAALSYGMYSVTQARPIWLAFEGDRFRVVAVPDVEASELEQAPKALQSYSWTGPKTIGVRLLASTDPNFAKSIELAMQGRHAAFRPERWVPYDTQSAAAVKKAKPLSEVRRKHPNESSIIDRAISSSGYPEKSLGAIPLASQHQTDWCVVINLQDGTPVAFLPLDLWD